MLAGDPICPQMVVYIKHVLSQKYLTVMKNGQDLSLKVIHSMPYWFNFFIVTIFATG